MQFLRINCASFDTGCTQRWQDVSVEFGELFVFRGAFCALRFLQRKQPHFRDRIGFKGLETDRQRLELRVSDCQGYCLAERKAGETEAAMAGGFLVITAKHCPA